MHLLRRRLLALPLVLTLAPLSASLAQPAEHVSRSEAAKSLAPSGRLRVAINLGNNVLAQRNAAGELSGISVILARELAKRLNLQLELIPFNAAGQVFDALETDAWDLAFLAIEPERATKIDFSPPYVVIEATYLVSNASSIRSVRELDRPGVKIAVARGAAYDLYLTRTLEAATLTRAATGADAIALFKAGGLDAVAGIRQFLDENAPGAGARVLEDHFSAVDQAIGIPHGRTVGAAYVRSFIEEMKASGSVRKALDATGQSSAAVAPRAVNAQAPGPRR